MYLRKVSPSRQACGKAFRRAVLRWAHRKCYRYEVGLDGELAVNPVEAKVVCWIFEQYLAGNSLGKVVAGLDWQGTGIHSPSGKPKWNCEAINKLLSNEKYTGPVLPQKKISTGASQIENDGLTD